MLMSGWRLKTTKSDPAKQGWNDTATVYNLATGTLWCGRKAGWLVKYAGEIALANEQ
jgi:hypothetical protein